MTDKQPVDRRGRALELCVEIPAVIVVFTMMVHVTANALMRTMANTPVPNTLEMVQYIYLPIVALLGFIAAQHRGQHVAAELVFQALPSVAKRYVLCAVMLLCSILMAAFAWFGMQEALHRTDMGQMAGFTEIPSWPVYFLLPLAFGSMTCQFLYGAWLALAGTPPEKPAPSNDAATDEPIMTNLERI